MKTRIIPLVIAFLLVAVTGCSSKNTEENSAKELHHINVTRNMTDSGMIYNTNDKTCFFDFETLESIPLCAIPNCNHNVMSCLSKKAGRGPVLYNDNLYYFDSTEEVVENPDNVELKISTKLYKTALDSSQADVIAEFQGCSPDTNNRYALYGNTLFFIGSDLGPVMDEAGALSYGITGSKFSLCSINLENGKYENYGVIYDDSSYPGAKYTSSAVIKLVYDNKIYIKYSFKENIPNQDNMNDEFNILMFEFNPDNRKMSESTLPEARYDGEGYYVYNENGSAVVLTDAGEKITVDGCEAGINSRIVNNMLFLNGDLSEVFNLETKEIKNREKNSENSIIDYQNGYYIVQTPKMTFEKIAENDLFS